MVLFVLLCFSLQTSYCSGAVNGNWGCWSSCSRTCGSGTRYRYCNNPPPSDGGSSCSGSSSESCSPQHCPINGFWSEWTPYTTCTAVCGGGIIVLSRKCDNPTPVYGGSYCGDQSIKWTNCNTHPCPINGNWGMWSIWAACNSSKEGYQNRSRLCDSPPASYGGTVCSSQPTELRKCARQLKEEQLSCCSPSFVVGIVISTIVATAACCVVVFFFIRGKELPCERLLKKKLPIYQDTGEKPTQSYDEIHRANSTTDTTAQTNSAFEPSSLNNTDYFNLKI